MIPRKEKTNINWIFQLLNQSCGYLNNFYTEYMLLKEKGKVHPKTGHEGLKGE